MCAVWHPCTCEPTESRISAVVDFKHMCLQMIHIWLPSEVGAGNIKLVGGKRAIGPIVDHFAASGEMEVNTAIQVLWVEGMNAAAQASIKERDDKGQKKRSLAVLGNWCERAGAQSFRRPW